LWNEPGHDLFSQPHDQRVVILATVTLHVQFESLLDDVLPVRACLASKVVLTRFSARRDVPEHGKNVEHGGLTGAVSADDQLLGGRPKLEIHEAAIVGRV